MWKEEIENFLLREIRSSLKRFFSPDFTCKAIFITNLMFYKVVDAILLFVGKENANERKESLLSICRVQLFFCKVTTFPRNFQGFRENVGMMIKKNRRLSFPGAAYWMLFLIPFVESLFDFFNGRKVAAEILRKSLP